MKIIIITPIRSSSRSGNGTTTNRWTRIWRELGHQVIASDKYDTTPADMMIALHAWRSFESIRLFRKLYPHRPLVVALTGTDIYEYLERDPGPTLHSLACADLLIALHELAHFQVPARWRRKVRIIYQSSPPLPRFVHRRSPRSFDVAVIGHLRDIKDPLRAAKAARGLPPNSRIRVVHLGAAKNAEWAAKAQAEMQANPRYVWRGDRPRADVRRLLGRARAMVLSSFSEGGANVISEAVTTGVPVLASHIDGSVGLLGHKYSGYFPVGDTAALTRLLSRIETSPKFLARLRRAVAQRAPLFRPSREKGAWRGLINELKAKSQSADGCRPATRVRRFGRSHSRAV
jgi:putative glycosyltransferase (TIGR04348 family)